MLVPLVKTGYTVCHTDGILLHIKWSFCIKCFSRKTWVFPSTPSEKVVIHWYITEIFIKFVSWSKIIRRKANHLQGASSLKIQQLISYTSSQHFFMENLKFHSHACNSSPLVPVLSHMSEVTISVRFILILSSHQLLDFVSFLFPTCFAIKILCAFLSHASNMP
jgi:hypothetical protein